MECLFAVPLIVVATLLLLRWVLRYTRLLRYRYALPAGNYCYGDTVGDAALHMNVIVDYTLGATGLVGWSTTLPVAVEWVQCAQCIVLRATVAWVMCLVPLLLGIVTLLVLLVVVVAF